jgi:RNA polymerase sigma-70 factor (ECF subfamily)
MMLTDEHLMLAVKNGEVERFGELFERHHHRLFAFFYRMIGDASAADDLAQEVFVRMLKYRNGFGPDSQFRAWMYQIARNVRVDFLGKLQLESVLSRAAAADLRIALPDPLEKQEHFSVLRRALLALPEEKRELLILARYEELKYEAIAKMLQIEVGTVKVRIHRALKELRALFLKMSGEEKKCDVKKSNEILRST